MRSVTLSLMFLAMLLTQVGCRSAYRLRCTSWPSVAGVLAGEQMMGETPCTVTIPKKSELIRDDKIELTFCLLDGRAKTHVVDLHGLKPSNPFAEIVSMPFMLAGVGLLLLAGAGDEDKEESPFAEDDKRDKAGNLGMGLLGFGVMGAGAGVYHLCGGESDSLAGYDVHVYFDESSRD